VTYGRMASYEMCSSRSSLRSSSAGMTNLAGAAPGRSSCGSGVAQFSARVMTTRRSPGIFTPQP
jgi:hypothetical protein